VIEKVGRSPLWVVLALVVATAIVGVLFGPW